MTLLCHLLGHHWSGVITGFRSEDGRAIGRCTRCLIPIVSPTDWAAAALRERNESRSEYRMRAALDAGASMEEAVIASVVESTELREEDLARAGLPPAAMHMAPVGMHRADVEDCDAP